MYTVEELLNKKGIEYVPRGADFLIKCLNPNHDDSNPSLRVDKVSGIFNCFACAFKGNIFSFFGEAPNAAQIRRNNLIKKIQSKRTESLGLEIPYKAIPYRGTYRGLSPDTYQKFQAFEEPSKEFIGRVVFPITDYSGKIVLFIGRHMGAEVPKYLVYPAEAKMPLYPKVKPVKGSIILVEGMFDMLNLHDKGLDNAVCCFGVNQVTEHKLRLLRMYGTSSVYTMFDSDEAGQRGAEKVKALCEDIGLVCKNITLRKKDPGELSSQEVLKLKRALYDE